MAKKSKDTTATTAKSDAKTKPADPAATRNLIRLLNTLALLLAITAFLLQFFAVITHHWKRQVTYLDPVFEATNNRYPANVYDDSRIDQQYGLYSREVKVYANHDEQLDIWASTRFPRLDNDEHDLHNCLTQTSTLRGSLITCTDQLLSPNNCHCRRYPHWNAVIFFEVTALVLLGLVVLVVSLLTTQYHGPLKLAGIALSFLAFLFLLIGLIILLSYLKRETRSIADAYPHIHSRLSTQVGQRYAGSHHTAIRREAHETYRAYPLQPGQHPYNDTHFQEYSESERTWIYKPYTSVRNSAYVGSSQQVHTQHQTTQGPVLGAYNPMIERSRIYENTRAHIGYSTVLSILALIPALLLPAILGFSWKTAKTLGPEVKTVTTTTVRTEYVPVPHDVTVETVPLTRPVPADTARQAQYDSHGGRHEPTIVRDVHVRDDHPTATTTYRT